MKGTYLSILIRGFVHVNLVHELSVVVPTLLRLSGTLLAVNISLSLRLILDSKIPIPGVDLLTSIFPSYIEHKKDETEIKSMIKDRKNRKKPESIDDINNLDVSLDNESDVFTDTELDSNSNDSNSNDSN